MIIASDYLENKVFSKYRYDTFFLFSDNPQPSVPTVYPKQYPTYPLTDTSPIIPRSRPLRYVTPKYEIPDEKMME